MRAANPIERAIQQELKRRTRKIRVFFNEAALERLATAILVDIDEEWIATDRAYITMISGDGRNTPARFTDIRLRNLRLPSRPADRATFRARIERLLVLDGDWPCPWIDATFVKVPQNGGIVPPRRRCPPRRRGGAGRRDLRPDRR
jgi:hypothetical protein